MRHFLALSASALLASTLAGSVLLAQEDTPPTLPETVVEEEEPNAGNPPDGDGSAPPDDSFDDFGNFDNFDPFAPSPTAGLGLNLLGEVSSASQGRFGQDDIEFRPLSRPGEVLELVPGLIATQHSGSGKANQYFVRGFNLDHGTDFALRVDGVPINLPSHGHGQGYLDINWLIPELVAYGDYKLGPYYADFGDFSSAGGLDITYFNTLPYGMALATGGEFDYYRVLVANSQPLAGGNILYAYESVFYDGPWVTPEDFGKFNGVLRWSTGDDCHGLAVSALAYRAYWNATNQIPTRAVADGLVTRFGAIDPSDAGQSERLTLNAEYWNENGWSTTRANAFAVYYNMDLWSNFTFFLEDEVNGDQIEQIDERAYGGANLAHTLHGCNVDHTFGFQFRNDNVFELTLNHTREREVLENIRNDDVDQQSYSLYYINEAQLLEKVRSYIGLRGDFYRFHNNALSDPDASGETTAAIFSPKAGLVFGPWADTELYLNWGQSFHSNDARGVTAPVDPAAPLVKSDGCEIGTRSLLTEHWNTTLAAWYLELDSELVFVGDAGTTEPGPASHRFGLTWTNYWQFNDWLTFDADYAWVRPRFAGGEYIPNAVENVVSSGFTVQQPCGPWYATLRLRHYGPAALIEDNSARSGTTSLLNMQLGYQTEKLHAALDLFNLLDRDDNDITYYYDSRLPGEPSGGVLGYLFHPVQPFMARATVTLKY
jgi:hypothetical protein